MITTGSLKLRFLITDRIFAPYTHITWTEHPTAYYCKPTSLFALIKDELDHDNIYLGLIHKIHKEQQR